MLYLTVLSDNGGTPISVTLNTTSKAPASSGLPETMPCELLSDNPAGS